MNAVSISDNSPIWQPKLARTHLRPHVGRAWGGMWILGAFAL
jgi:hypothetical protein